MGKSGNFDTGTGELAPRAGEFLAGVLALSRISRATVALESGHGAGPALLAAARLSAHAETSLMFDQWQDNPLADLTAALFHTHPDLAPAPGESLVPGLQALQARKRHSFLLIFDCFDAYLGQAANLPQVAAFDRAFVEMANDGGLDVHFLLVMDESAESLLERYQTAIPGLGDGCLRMPADGDADSPNTAPAQETGRASRRDRSFGMLLERLTAIAPADDPTPARPNDPVPQMDAAPVVPEALAEPVQPYAEPKPERHAVPEATTVNEAPPARQEPVLAPREPTFEPLPAASATSPADTTAAPRLAANAPVRKSVTPETSPKRGKSLAAIMAVVLAVGAGFYAYKQQAPTAAPGMSAGTTPAVAASAVATPPAPPTTLPAQTQPASPAPALMAAPTMAAAPPAPATPAAPAAASPAGTTATVYVHVRSQRDRERMQSLARALAGQGIRVVDVKVMSKGPSVADLRYFRDEDKATAMAVQKAMASAGVPVPRLSRMSGYEGSTRPGHFEAWLGGGTSEETARRR